MNRRLYLCNIWLLKILTYFLQNLKKAWGFKHCKYY